MSRDLREGFMKFQKFYNPHSGRASGSCKITCRFFSNLKMIITEEGVGNQCINYTSAGGQKLIFIVIQMTATLAL